MIDLHTHTTCSDGLLSVTELIDLAIQEGISTLAIADHDTVSGIAQALSYAKQQAIRVVPAIELSVDCTFGDFHLLGYGIDHTQNELTSELLFYQKEREERIPKIIAALQSAGLQLSMDDLEIDENHGGAGKPHIARALIKTGQANSFDEVFEKYLGKGKIGDIPKKKIPVEKAFELITLSGGSAVLAHPVSLNLSIDSLFSYVTNELIPLGLQGIEVYANMHSDEEVRAIHDFALEQGLLISGGSDYHGDSEKTEKLGYYGAKRLIPEDRVSLLNQI